MPIIEVNGEQVEFPDSMSDAEIEGVLRKEYGGSQINPITRGFAQAGRNLALGAASIPELAQTVINKPLYNASALIAEKLGFPQTAAQYRGIAQASPVDELRNFIDTKTQGQLQPAGAGERYIEQAQQFIGGGLAMNPLAAGNLASLGTRTAPQIAGLTGAAIGSQTAEEAGLGAAGQFVGGLAGGMAGAAALTPKPETSKKVVDFLGKMVTPEEAKQTLKSINRLEQIGIKAPLGAATASEPVFQIASTRAKTLEGARDARVALDSVIEGITKTEGDFIKNLAAQSKNSVDDAMVFKSSATSIKNALVDARRAKAQPLYEAIADKAIPPSWLKGLTNKNPIIAQQLDNVSTDPVMQQFLQGAKPNTVGYLDKVKQAIDAKISVAARQGDNTSVAAYQQAKGNLIDAVEQYVPAYKDARMAFANDTEVLEYALGGKKGAIKQIIEMADEDAVKAYNKIFSMQPEQIAQTRRTFEKLGQKEAFGALTRGYLSQKLAKAAGSQDEQVLLSRVLNNKVDRDRIMAAIGSPKKIEMFNRVLEASDIVARSKELSPRFGSQTYVRGEVEKQMQQQFQSKFGQGAGWIGRQRQRITGVIGMNTKELQEISKKESYYTELQKILFSPDEGKRFLEQYLKGNEAQKAEVLGNVINNAATRAMATSAGAQSAIQAGE